VVVLLLAVVCLIEASAGLELIPTPFGLRPKQCVHRAVGENVLIQPIPGAVRLIDHTTGAILHEHPTLPECVEWEEKMKAQRRAAYEANILQDGWLDNAGYYTPGFVGSFVGNYQVPQNPAAGNAGQILYYFIGAVNYQSNMSDTILQPVLTWGSGYPAWSIASWNCCPSGQAHESTPMQGFGSGATLTGKIINNGRGQWTVVSTYGTSSTTLTVPNNGRTFDWIDATLETCSVQSCDQFADGPMIFSNMAVTLAAGGQVTPEWMPSSPTECNGQLTVDDPSRITIQHN